MKARKPDEGQKARRRPESQKKTRKPEEGQKARIRPESQKKARKPEEGQKAKISHEFHVNNVQRTEKSKLSDMRKTGIA
jgi:hypothetical protein